VAEPVRSDPFSWGSATGATGTGTGFVNAPPTAHGTGFRRLDEHVATVYYNTPASGFRAVGTFDPTRLPGFTDPDVAPLNSFHAPAATAADARSREVLQGQPLVPDANMAGYLTPPPLMLTTIDAASVVAGQPPLRPRARTSAGGAGQRHPRPGAGRDGC
jgi:hypothetical protein